MRIFVSLIFALFFLPTISSAIEVTVSCTSEPVADEKIAEYKVYQNGEHVGSVEKSVDKMDIESYRVDDIFNISAVSDQQIEGPKSVDYVIKRVGTVEVLLISGGGVQVNVINGRD